MAIDFVDIDTIGKDRKSLLTEINNTGFKIVNIETIPSVTPNAMGGTKPSSMIRVWVDIPPGYSLSN
jgi:ribosomal protein S11